MAKPAKAPPADDFSLDSLLDGASTVTVSESSLSSDEDEPPLSNFDSDGLNITLSKLRPVMEQIEMLQDDVKELLKTAKIQYGLKGAYVRRVLKTEKNPEKHKQDLMTLDEYLERAGIRL